MLELCPPHEAELLPMISHGPVDIQLTLEVRGQEIILSKEAIWKKLQGAGAGLDIMSAFAADKKRGREREDSRA
jgi:hypothetical protein